MPNKTVYRNQYQAPAFMVDTLDISIDLFEDHILVTSTLNMRRQGSGPLLLKGEDLELVSIAMNGVPLKDSDYEIDDKDLVIKQSPDVVKLDIVVRIFPQNNTELSGLYRSKDLFCTQCEPEGFRRITFYPDRPDVLTQFTTRISADKARYPVLLSNGNLIDSGSEDHGRHWVVWKDPFKKPSYLFALVAGDLACIRDQFITASGRTVDLRLYVEPGNEDKCAFALSSLKKAMRWDEEVYGREYDLDVFMIVAVSDFNMGAMENKGLNIFNSKFILARPDTATDEDYIGIEAVVAHEYFHNWTGNRVTCRDWFQLSLKEGLTVFRDQEFSRDMNSRDVFRIRDVATLRSTQFPEDAGSMAHPVRPESYQEINNFYTTTVYEKGAEVIRMQHSLLGPEGFRKGMDLYFDRHDGTAVTIDDFVAAMEDANGVDLSQFKLWYSQSGTPKVSVKSSYSEGKLTLMMEQNGALTADNAQQKKPFHIPVRIVLLDANGQKLPLEKDILELKERQQNFVFSGLKERPVLSLLGGFSAPVRLEDELSQEDLLFLLAHETDGYAKWEASRRLILSFFRDCFKTSPSDEQSTLSLLAGTLNHVLLDESLGRDLRAELVSPPRFDEIASALLPVDVSAVEAARDEYRHYLGLHLYEDLFQVYTQIRKEDLSLDKKAYPSRALANVCLSLMMRGKEKEALVLCQKQFTNSSNMTDQLASFSLLAQCSDEEHREEAIQKFYKQWSDEELVLDKWFAIQATSEVPGTLNRVRQLLKHPAFNIKNPNKVRALVGAFCMSNPRHFHALDGSGYAFLTEMVLIVDRINAQIAARLANPFTRWQMYDKPRQQMIQGQLRALTKATLSPDLREVVDKSLASI